MNNAVRIAKHRVVTSGLRFPEGPVACADGSVMVVEIAGGCVTRVAPDGTKSVVAQTGGGPNGLAVGPGGAIYVCNNGGYQFREHNGLTHAVGPRTDYTSGRIERIDPVTFSVDVVYDACNASPLSGPNDIVFDNAGGFYFTDLGQVRLRDRNHGGIYYGLADGSAIKELVFPFLTPNGIAVSPDGRTLYVAQTETARLWAFDVTSPGVIQGRGNGPGGARLVFAAGGYQRFDSLAVEASGNICIGTLISEVITVVTPDGNIVRKVGMPPAHPTNICFGGPDLKTAYITLSSSGLLIEVDWPEAGLRLNYQVA